MIQSLRIFSQIIYQGKKLQFSLFSVFSFGFEFEHSEFAFHSLISIIKEKIFFYAL